MNSHTISEAANQMYDGPIPADVSAEIERQSREERKASAMAQLLLLPAQERWDAMAKHEWNEMRRIWRFGNLASLRDVADRQKRAGHEVPHEMRLRLRHLWREARDLTVPHLIAWRAFRDAHRKMAMIDKEAA